MKINKTKLLPPVQSFAHLKTMIHKNPAYAKLTILGAQNLGGEAESITEALKWLEINIMESGDEEGVIEEVNSLRDLLNQNEEGYTLTELLIAVVSLVGVGVVGLLIWVAIHFISKYW